MGCCSGIIRVLLFIFNFVFWLIGLALLGIGIWLLVDPASKAIQSVLSFYGIAVYIIIAAGAITTVVGFLGCCGACKESKCLLIMFSIFLGIIFAVEVAAGIVAIVQRGLLSDLITDSFADILNQEPDLESLTGAVKVGVVAMQAGLQCCGLNATSNWANPQLEDSCKCTGPTQGVPTVPPGITTGPTTAAPSTTSVVMTTSNGSVPVGPGGGGTGGGSQDPDACVGGLYQPCEGKLQTFLEDNFLIVGVAALVFSVVQIIGICFSCIVIKNANTDVGPV
ncbi:CD9 antigen-like [Branchiostoma floridae]|uniref:Tetraspanin n=1 Tax=Branchiostoma floridae TaxID=7739 RepID=A0A9J7L1W9_BRAFL|nr:CD9 antigen-like [Branchiostoma floridae]